MIDHVSIAVRDLDAGTRFYEDVLVALGYTLLVTREATVGFGKRYPEFWLNHRPGRAPGANDGGANVCLRARDPKTVAAFHSAALAAGGSDAGPPGPRPQYGETYHAAFIRDPDGNLIEAVTFVESEGLNDPT